MNVEKEWRKWEGGRWQNCITCGGFSSSGYWWNYRAWGGRATFSQQRGRVCVPMCPVVSGLVCWTGRPPPITSVCHSCQCFCEWLYILTRSHTLIHIFKTQIKLFGLHVNSTVIFGQLSWNWTEQEKMSMMSNELLLCADACPEVMPVAVKDPAIMSDRRVLQQLLGLEMFSVPSSDYFAPNSTSELQPYMRRVVTTWMLEVNIFFSMNSFFNSILRKQ